MIHRRIIVTIICALLCAVSVMAQKTATHVVQQGESLKSIAAQYGISDEDLRSANKNVSFCFPGMKLNVPKDKSAKKVAKNIASTTTDVATDTSNKPKKKNSILKNLGGALTVAGAVAVGAVAISSSVKDAKRDIKNIWSDTNTSNTSINTSDIASQVAESAMQNMAQNRSMHIEDPQQSTLSKAELANLYDAKYLTTNYITIDQVAQLTEQQRSEILDILRAERKRFSAQQLELIKAKDAADKKVANATALNATNAAYQATKGKMGLKNPSISLRTPKTTAANVRNLNTSTNEMNRAKAALQSMDEMERIIGSNISLLNGKDGTTRTYLEMEKSANKKANKAFRQSMNETKRYNSKQAEYDLHTGTMNKMKIGLEEFDAERYVEAAEKAEAVKKQNNATNKYKIK